tara:strand:- start:1146 stop:1364 length:219 start_codon:yes stop_codon:yes gene_type:complete
MNILDISKLFKRSIKEELPIGVHFNEKTQRYIVRVPSRKSINLKIISLGKYVLEQDAFDKYNDYMSPGDDLL